MKNLFSKIRKNLRVLVAIILIVIVVGGFYYWQIRKGRIFIDDSLISATIINVSPTTAGRLLEMAAQEGKFVKKGDVLAVVGSETIRSTTDGLVVMANNQIGGSFTPQNSVAQIIDQSQMRVVGTIDENKGLNKLNVGQVASFTVDAFPGQTFWGFVDEVSPTAKQTQLSFSISSERPIQQFQVYVRFPVDKYPQLKNGMSAKLTIFTDTN
jgi:multidrug resistance efflux pump